jgi:pSer/pThr/pTyr-binding forkhead associated (FHA) protein
VARIPECLPASRTDSYLWEEASIEDLGSKNGTYIRGERLATLSSLTDGDEIRVGSVVVKFRSVDASGVTETQHVG